MLVSFNDGLPNDGRRLSGRRVGSVMSSTSTIFCARCRKSRVNLRDLVPSYVGRCVKAKTGRMVLYGCGTLGGFNSCDRRVGTARTVLPCCTGHHVSMNNGKGVFIAPCFIDRSTFSTCVLAVRYRNGGVLRANSFHGRNCLNGNLVPALNECIKAISVLVARKAVLDEGRRRMISRRRLRQGMAGVLGRRGCIFTLYSSASVRELTSFRTTYGGANEIFLMSRCRGGILSVFSERAKGCAGLFHFSTFGLVGFCARGMGGGLAGRNFLVPVHTGKLRLIGEVLSMCGSRTRCLVCSV